MNPATPEGRAELRRVIAKRPRTDVGDLEKIEQMAAALPAALDAIERLEAERDVLRDALEAETHCETCDSTGIMGGECDCVLSLDRPSPTCLMCTGKGSWEATCAECDGVKRSYRSDAARVALSEATA